MAENILLTELSEEMTTEDGEDILLEDSDGDGVQDMTFANNFSTAHVSVGTMKIQFGGFNR